MPLFRSRRPSAERLFRQSFWFEAGSVRLGKGVFRPLKDAVRRWVLEEPCAYRVLGMNFFMLYELRTGGFVYLQYLHCHKQRTEEGYVFVGDLKGTRRVTAQEALDFLLDHHFDLPESLEKLLEGPSAEEGEPSATGSSTPLPHEPAPVRPLEYWLRRPVFEGLLRPSAQSTDPFLEAKRVQRSAGEAVRLLHRWKSDRGARSGSRYAMEELAHTLFGRFLVDPNAWWGNVNEIPPEHVDVVGLRWPEGAEPVRDALRELQSLFDAPLRVLMAPQVLGNVADYPSDAEQAAAQESLIARLPEIEAAAVRLRGALGTIDASKGARREEGAERRVASSPGETSEADGAATRDDTEEAFVFQRAGGVWTLRFDGETVHATDRKGLWYLAQLLTAPNRPVAAMDLFAQYSGDQRTRASGSSWEQSDRPALEAYHDELVEFDKEIDEAKHNHDHERHEVLATKREALADRIRADRGLGGQPRQKSDRDRVRKSVGAAIQRALDQIEGDHPPLYKHLVNSLETGALLTYRPEQPIQWLT